MDAWMTRLGRPAKFRLMIARVLVVWRVGEDGVWACSGRTVDVGVRLDLRANEWSASWRCFGVWSARGFGLMDEGSDLGESFGCWWVVP